MFTDFDGTITTEDTLTGAIKPFVKQEEFYEYYKKLEKGEMTLSQVVRYAYDGRPARWIPDMLKYIDAVEIRPGFGEFLDRMAELRIPVVVISSVFSTKAGTLYGQDNGSPCRGAYPGKR